MSVTCTELAGRKTYIDDKGEFRGTRIFSIISSSRLTGTELISGLPRIGERYPGGTFPLYCANASADEKEQLESGWAWEVTCNYEARGMNLYGNQGWSTDPLSRPPVHSWPSASQIDEFKRKDLDDKWFTNTAGDFLDPPPPFQKVFPVMQVRRNFRPDFWTATRSAYYHNACNSETYFGAAPGFARLLSIVVGEPRCENEIWYCEATILIEFRDESWENDNIVSEGPRELDDNGKLVYAKDAEGNVSTAFHLLDEDGQFIIDPNNPPANLDEVQPFYITFRMRNKVSFKGLGL